MADELKRRGVFCIETVWFGPSDKTSMRPILEALQDGYLQVPFVHRTAMTAEELRHNLEDWKKLHREQGDYPILYLGYHGHGGEIILADREWDIVSISLEKLGGALNDGACADCVIHFGSCSTLDVEDIRIADFLNKTEASAVSGYGDDVDWIDSASFDLFYFKEMQSGGRQSLTPNVMRNIRNGNKSRWGLLEEDGGFGRSPYFEWAQHLGFKLEVVDR